MQACLGRQENKLCPKVKEEGFIDFLMSWQGPLKCGLVHCLY